MGPLNAALSPNGRYLLVASSGLTRYDTVDLFDLRAHRRAAHILYDSQRRGVRSVFYGVAFSADGKRAWAAGGGQNVIHSYTVRGGRLTPGRDIPNRYFPAGLAYARTPRGPRLYVADNAGGRPSLTANPPGYRVSAIDLTARGKRPLRQRRVSLGAALTVLLGTRLGLPVSTTHALTGGLLGAGLAAAPGQVQVVALAASFLLPLLFSPVVSLALITSTNFL